MANIDNKALYNIGYGLYVITSNDGVKHNGMICNTVIQLTGTPLTVGVTINKSNYTCDIVQSTGIMNVNLLTESAPFSIFEKYGFSSGRDVNKFENTVYTLSENGLTVLNEYINSYMSLKVKQSIDLGTHVMFICDVTEAEVINNDPSMTYAYYHKNVKPKPAAKTAAPSNDAPRGYMCKICGYVYEGHPLPEDFVCPLCKHPASDFEPVE